MIDTQTWRIVATDAAYAGTSYGAAFAPDGHLYTVAYDHKLRQYGPGPAFQKEREVLTRDENRPFSIAVDPRGQLLAIGFDNSTHLDIYDAATLKVRFAADLRGIDNGVIPSIAWSSDGAHLLAAGSYNILFQGQPKMPLLTFGRDGQRIGGPLLLGDNSVQNLQSCGDAIAVAASDPAFGLVDNNGRIKLWKTSVAADMVGKAEPGAFTIAADARQVRFGLGYVAAEPVLFDLAQGTIASSPSLPPGFIAPLVEGLPVDNWYGEDHPTFAGRPIELKEIERSRSLAIRRDRAGFVLGTAFYLRAFDAHGRQRWRQNGPGETWGVNFSADGRIVVAAY